MNIALYHHLRFLDDELLRPDLLEPPDVFSFSGPPIISDRYICNVIYLRCTCYFVLFIEFVRYLFVFSIWIFCLCL